MKAVMVLEAVVFALHSRQEMPKRPLSSTSCTPVRMAAAYVIESFPFWANFWHSFSYVKKVSIGVGGDQGVDMTVRFSPS